MSDGIVDRPVLLRGYREGLGRFHEARIGTDTVDAYLPLFEALNWAASLDEHLDYPDHPELRGMRFARNRVHHQWAEALYVTEGAAYPRAYPRVFFEWRWRMDLPEAGCGQTSTTAYRFSEMRPLRR